MIEYLDMNGMKLKKGFYVDASPNENNFRIQKDIGKNKRPIYFFTGEFDIENDFPIFSFFNGYKGETLQSYSKYFCKNLKPVDKTKIENKIEYLEEELNVYKENLARLKSPTTN